MPFPDARASVNTCLIASMTAAGGAGVLLVPDNSTELPPRLARGERGDTIVAGAVQISGTLSCANLRLKDTKGTGMRTKEQDAAEKRKSVM